MKKVLFVTDGIFHPTVLGRLRLIRVFRHMDGFSFRRIRSLEQLPANLDQFAALVLHYHHKRLSAGALARLEQFVKNGGGILAIHAATASFKDTPPYFEILGGRFIGHGKIETFEARLIKDELFSGIDSFVVIDELYIHEIKPGIEVHFTAKLADQDIPVVWTYRYGKGKVCYTAPGHTTATMSNPVYQEVLKRGLIWVTE